VSLTSQNSIFKRWLAALWALAALVALVNALGMARRAPLLWQQVNGPDEQAAQAAARWIRPLPSDARVLALLSKQNVRPGWFRIRLNYLVYPRRYEATWDALPADAARRFDYVLAYHSAQAAVPASWNRLATVERASLFVSAAGETAQSAQAAREAPLSPMALIGRALAGLFGLAVVAALGALLLSRTVPCPPFAAWWGNLALAHLVGAAAVAWLVTLIALATHRLLAWPVYGAALLLAPGWRLARAWLFPQARTDARKATPLAAGATAWRMFLIGLIALGVLTALERGWLIGFNWIGEWDSYAIWQFKAKAFFLDGDLSLLRDTVRFEYAHLDYPLLVPLQSWWLYRHVGAVSEGWAQLAGFCFTLDALALCAAFAARYVSRFDALLGTALLATLPVFSSHALSGYAEVPMAAYTLALGGCLVSLLTAQEPASIPLLAWLLAGVVLVKNEGLLACLSALLVVALYALRASRPKRIGASDWMLWIGAAACAYLPWLLCKRQEHLTNDLLSPKSHPPFTAALLAWRLGYTLRSFALQLARVGPWYPCWGLLGLLVPVGLFAAARRRVSLSGPLWLLSLFQLLGYTGIYLITPASLAFHIGSSIERLVLHIAPDLLLAALLACFGPSLPEESV